MSEPSLVFDVESFSPFLARARRDPQLASLIDTLAAQPVDAQVLAAAFAGLPAESGSVQALAQQLRHLRRSLISALALRDLTGQAALPEVEGAMTAFAHLAIGKLLPIISQAVYARTGQPVNVKGEPIDLLVIGMGKLGAGELNVSSDIDIVYAAPEYGQAGESDALEAFAQVAQQLTRALQDVSADGFIFRVDTRLRPFGEVGPAVVSLGALEHYFMAHGRFWERCAWLKATIVSPRMAMPAPAFDAARQRLAQAIGAFVYKRYTDYTTIEGLADLASRIRTQRQGARGKFAEDDVKLGRGGIREVELLAQGLSIMHGGRNPSLQVGATRMLLARLAAAGRLPQDVAAQLDAHYVLLRRVEHALQYRNDEQTHNIPQESAERGAVAAALGFQSLAEFDRTLADVRAYVAAQFDAFLPGPAQAQGAPPAVVQARIAPWLSAVARENEATQRRFEQVLAAFDAQLPDDEHFARAARFVQAIARRRTYLDLLLAHSAVVARVAKLMAASPFAADYLTAHPILLDELIDPKIGTAAVDWAAFDAELAAQLAHDVDTERRMNVLREAHHAQVLRILARDLAGHIAVEAISDELSLLADKLLAAALACAWHTLAPGAPLPKFAVIAYGRLGAKEMGYASDLDLVFLFDGDADELELPTRLAQRIASWLSAATTSGRLFEVDLRLRPNGNAGLLVTTLAAFERYQQTAALWEHQALSRARFVCGDAQVGARFEAFRNQMLALPREWNDVANEVASMRKRVLEGHPNKTPLFDIKHDPGGLVDMEFAVQALVLAHASKHPELLANKGTIALAGRAAQARLIDAQISQAAQDGYRLLRGLQHTRRLAGDDVGRVEISSVEQPRNAVRAFVDALGLEFPQSR
ncbi:MAG: bifunctional [glutamate--ammonia ligase]-adenylyl-L-tyrosine phosphorylase/[glutamate--ammonia-ligase] adenylyltransferase [Burkholderiaceae bacterium]